MLLSQRLRNLLASQYPWVSVSSLNNFYGPLAQWVQSEVDVKRKHGCALVVGVNGAQGSGKSTLCDVLKCITESSSFRLNVAIISIDDVYLTRNERLDLASSIHPLCASRGVPGTHDVQLAHRTLDALCDAETPTAFIPRFDKSKDDRCPQSAFDVFRGVPDVIFFEGWCVGAASPSREDAWSGPTNAREKLQDPDGVWAKWSDAALASDAYQSLFGRIDKLVMIKVPSSIDTVIDSSGSKNATSSIASNIPASTPQNASSRETTSQNLSLSTSGTQNECGKKCQRAPTFSSSATLRLRKPFQDAKLCKQYF